MLTKEALEGLRWIASGGQAGTEPPYAVHRALIAAKLVSPAGTITDAGQQRLVDAVENSHAGAVIITDDNWKIEQIASAYMAVSRVNHYLVGIVGPISDEELSAAHQHLITRQNNNPANSPLWKALDKTIDLVEADMKKRGIA